MFKLLTLLVGKLIVTIHASADHACSVLDGRLHVDTAGVCSGATDLLQLVAQLLVGAPLLILMPLLLPAALLAAWWHHS